MSLVVRESSCQSVFIEHVNNLKLDLRACRRTNSCRCRTSDFSVAVENKVKSSERSLHMFAYMFHGIKAHDRIQLPSLCYTVVDTRTSMRHLVIGEFGFSRLVQVRIVSRFCITRMILGFTELSKSTNILSLEA